ncbi:MAG: hypothetical protein JXQ75_07850 [Phycisphaerae bacterium]|nr:hypothetical protein [Phycisphaerae bacterium]
MRDPSETNNLIDAGTEDIGELRIVLGESIPRFKRSHEAVLARLEESRPTEIDPAVEQRLRDLGYLE